MSLTSALNNARQGLSVTSLGVGLASENIANANDPAYTRKSQTQTDLNNAGGSGGVRAGQVRRELDVGLQRLVRELGGSVSSADVNARFTERLTAVFGDPNSDTAFNKIFDRFQAKLNELSARPESASLRAEVVNDAKVLSGRLNSASETILSFRQSIENELDQEIEALNTALSKLSTVNKSITQSTRGTSYNANFLDQRDFLLQEISSRIEINITELPNGAVQLSSKGGQVLLSDEPSTINFVRHAVDHPEAIYDPDPTKSGVGVIQLNNQGKLVNITPQSELGKGSLSALVHQRDTVYPQALSQLDDIAHALASNLNRNTSQGTAVTSGASKGFDLDTSGLASGNRIQVNFDEDGVKKSLTIVRVDSADTLPLPETELTGNHRLVGIDFSKGLADVATDLNAVTGGSLVFSDQGSNKLRVLDDGAGEKVDILDVEAHSSATGFDGQGLGIPLFVDTNDSAYTDNREGLTQRRGFSNRISLHSDLSKDASKLVIYDLTAGSETPAGDGSRPEELFRRLSEIQVEVSPASGLSFAVGTETISLSDLVGSVISKQSQATDQAKSAYSTADASFEAFSSQYLESSSVDLDEEFALILELQTAYAANARVLTTVNEMARTLLSI